MAKLSLIPQKGAPRHFVAAWRERAGFKNQDALADAIGVSRGLISQLENGTTAYTQASLEAIATACNCAPLDLLRDPAGGVERRDHFQAPKC